MAATPAARSASSPTRSGDLSEPLAAAAMAAHEVVVLGDQALERRAPQPSDAAQSGRTVFKSVGVAVEDIVAADVVWRRKLRVLG